jgi:hypothetical protein
MWTRQAGLGERIDPAWINTLERRLRRRAIFWLGCFTLFIGGLLIQFTFVAAISLIEWKLDGPLWALLAAPFMAAFLFWIFSGYLSCSSPSSCDFSLGWTETAAVVRLRDWARRIGALWRRVNAKKTKKS